MAALHSLKRNQLQKLCKLHKINASGKNVAMVERLEQYALTLSPNAADKTPVADSLEQASWDESFSEVPEEPAGMSTIIETDEPSIRGTAKSVKSGRDAVGEFGTGHKGELRAVRIPKNGMLNESV